MYDIFLCKKPLYDVFLFKNLFENQIVYATKTTFILIFYVQNETPT